MTWRVETDDDEFPGWKWLADVEREDAAEALRDWVWNTTGGVIEVRITELEPVDEGKSLQYVGYGSIDMDWGIPTLFRVNPLRAVGKLKELGLEITRER